ncbi:MAG: 30S ribosomal protein S8 [Nitrospirota bacterium]|jgi:small subunit ribosomal protein S8|nr:30S ribosomal protein S8 [Nitrospirota bacterium]MDX2419763.1 30S ribosomal protein S8 [Nitrospirota bacterium]
MSMTDPIADLFVRVQNAGRRGHDLVKMPASRVKGEILKIFKKEGFIKDFQSITTETHPTLQVALRYVPGRQKQSFITGIKRISKPGCRVYAGKNDIPRVMKGLGVAIMTTDQGLLTDEECRTKQVGGEVLCHIW